MVLSSEVRCKFSSAKPLALAVGRNSWVENRTVAPYTILITKAILLLFVKKKGDDTESHPTTVLDTVNWEIAKLDYQLRNDPSRQTLPRQLISFRLYPGVHHTHFNPKLKSRVRTLENIAIKPGIEPAAFAFIWAPQSANKPNPCVRKIVPILLRVDVRITYRLVSTV
ncbi:hypothetical protein O181_025766 [Austropuccinia psidii MF-1]|uniref:Uncharacterized protein n=1 Tax=Austropuccinia psidii MF-1 TaxID=1389203 RepID=A0A9Q3CP35_9BASI|nr:hypothetical protein [Austropuccinia psidii MF-1]